jgi:mono/diheme cytochrome c family protein
MFLSNKMSTVLKSALSGLIFVSLTAAAENPEFQEEPTLKRQQELRQMLLQDCGVCHGKLLQGDIGPPLTAESLAGKTEEELLQTIMEGHDKTAMPSWWWMMKEHEARWLIRFIRRAKISWISGE